MNYFANMLLLFIVLILGFGHVHMLYHAVPENGYYEEKQLQFNEGITLVPACATNQNIGMWVNVRFQHNFATFGLSVRMTEAEYTKYCE